MARKNQTPETTTDAWPTADEAIEIRATCIEHGQALLPELRRLGENDLANKLEARLEEWRIDEQRSANG